MIELNWPRYYLCDGQRFFCWPKPMGDGPPLGLDLIDLNRRKHLTVSLLTTIAFAPFVLEN
jgi:hypothetical protein